MIDHHHHSHHHHHHHHHHQHPANPTTFSSSSSSSSNVDIGSKTSPIPKDNIKCGYFKVKKSKNLKERFCVLKSESSSETARFEYYENERKFKNASPPKYSLLLKDCFNISRKYPSHRGDNQICFYTKEDCITMAFDDEKQLNEWLQILIELTSFMHSNMNAKYERVWQVVIPKNKNIEREKLVGTYRLCLTNDKKLHLIKLAQSELDPVMHELPLSTVRTLGHTKKYFQLDLGRGATIGAGILCMQTDDEAQSRDMHEAILRKIDRPPSSSELEPSISVRDGTRPRSASTSENFRPLLSRRTSGESILPSNTSQTAKSSASTATTPSTPITITPTQPLQSPSLCYTAISGRDRCDSLPSNYRKPPLSHNATRSMSNSSEMVKPHGSSCLNGRLSSSPSSKNPLSPSCCSTDSVGSSLSEDSNFISSSDYYAATALQTREFPPQPPIQEESASAEEYLFMGMPAQSHIKNKPALTASSSSFTITTAPSSKQTLRSSLNLMLDLKRSTSKTVSNKEPSTVDTFSSSTSSAPSLSNNIDNETTVSTLTTPQRPSTKIDDKTSSINLNNNQTDDDYLPMSPMEGKNNWEKQSKVSTIKEKNIDSMAATNISTSSMSNVDDEDDGYVPMMPIAKQASVEADKSKNIKTSSSTALLSSPSTVTAAELTTFNLLSLTDKSSPLSAEPQPDDINKNEQNENDYFELKDVRRNTESAKGSSSDIACSSGVSSQAQSRARSIEEFKLDSVKSYLSSQDEENRPFDYIKPVRAYSMGSKPSIKDGAFSKSFKALRANKSPGELPMHTTTAKCDSQARVRSLSMGSQNSRIKSTNFKK